MAQSLGVLMLGRTCGCQPFGTGLIKFKSKSKMQVCTCILLLGSENTSHRGKLREKKREEKERKGLNCLLIADNRSIENTDSFKQFSTVHSTTTKKKNAQTRWPGSVCSAIQHLRRQDPGILQGIRLEKAQTILKEDNELHYQASQRTFQNNLITLPGLMKDTQEPQKYEQSAKYVCPDPCL